jgi:hypothetical protein
MTEAWYVVDVIPKGSSVIADATGVMELHRWIWVTAEYILQQRIGSTILPMEFSGCRYFKSEYTNYQLILKSIAMFSQKVVDIKLQPRSGYFYQTLSHLKGLRAVASLP